MNAAIDIGRFRLVADDDPRKVWVLIQDGAEAGEAMQTEMKRLERWLEKFYEDEF